MDRRPLVHDWLFVVLLLGGVALGAKQNVPIGVLVTSPDAVNASSSLETEQLRVAINMAISDVSNSDFLLPDHTIVPIILPVFRLGTYEAVAAVCSLLRQGVVAIVGPYTSTSTIASYPMADGFHVPMVVPYASSPTLSNRELYKYLLRLVPPDSEQSRALASFLKNFHFSTVAILTDHTEYGTNGLIEFQSLAAANKWLVPSVQQFVATENVSLVNAREQLLTIRSSGARIVILNCYAEHAVEVLKQAKTLGMLDAGWMWIGTDGITSSMDFVTAVNGSMPYLEGFLGTLPVSSDGALYPSFKQKWASASNGLPFSNAVLGFYDAILVVANGLQKALVDEKRNMTVVSSDCFGDDPQPWAAGDALNRLLGTVKINGTTRLLEFNSAGSPTQPKYQIVRLSSTGWEKVGTWVGSGSDVLGVIDVGQTFVNKSILGGQKIQRFRDYVGDLANKTLRVAVVLEQPFVSLSTTNPQGNPKCKSTDCFTGYCIDLLAKLALELNFTVELYVIQNGSYGVLLNASNGLWDGLVAELIPDENRTTRADVVVGPLAITSKRQQFISMTNPYRDLQMTVLVKISPDEEFNAWSFLIPFMPELWAYIVVTAIVVGVVITIVDKLSPYGHYGRKAMMHDGAEEAMDKNEDGQIDEWEIRDWEIEKSYMSLSNAIFWSISSLLQQGGEVHPKSWSGRVAAIVWWFGIVILVSTYTANLAAFLTVKTTANDIKTVDDLYKSSLQYAYIVDTHVEDYFENATKSPYKEMGQKITTWGKQFHSVYEAIQYMNGTTSFALIVDEPIAEYWSKLECSFKMIQEGFGNIGYGFGLPQGSSYVGELTLKILDLRERGYIDELDNKWLSSGSKCDTSKKDVDSSAEIDIKSMWGVFLICYCGFGVSFVVLIIEWIVSTAAAVDPSDPEKPANFIAALKRRWGRLVQDIKENWFPISCGKPNLDPRLQQAAQRRPSTAVVAQTNNVHH